MSLALARRRPARGERAAAAALAVAAALATATPARAQPVDGGATPSESDVDIAKAHFATGQAYYEHGRFSDAAREFEEAYRLSGKPPLLYNVGKSYDGANDFARALAAYRRFLAAAPGENADHDFAVERVQRLAALVGTVTLQGAVAGSAITLDGEPAGTTPLPSPLVVNPGRHRVEVARERYATFRRAVDVPVGGAVVVEAQQVESVKVVTLAAPSPAARERPLYQRWWLWAAVGGAVVAAGVITAVVLTTSTTSSAPTVQLPAVR
jgi:tetratricopeptide (TPR) repeat protein